MLLLFFLISSSLNYEALCLNHLQDLKALDSLLKDYDKRGAPPNIQGALTEVNCELMIQSIEFSTEKEKDYSVDLFLRQQWKDSRLKNLNTTEPLELHGARIVQALWKPEVYFPNAKKAEFQYVTVPNLVLNIGPGGQIDYLLRLTLTFSRMDDKRCNIELASLSKQLRLKWNSPPLKLRSTKGFPSFGLTSVETGSCDEETVIGDYSCISLTLPI